jgi:alpha-L-arabinofuranosidase
MAVVNCEIQQGSSMNDTNTPLMPDKVTFKPHNAKKEGAVIKLDAPERSVIFITLK